MGLGFGINSDSSKDRLIIGYMQTRHSNPSISVPESNASSISITPELVLLIRLFYILKSVLYLISTKHWQLRSGRSCQNGRALTAIVGWEFLYSYFAQRRRGKKIGCSKTRLF